MEFDDAKTMVQGFLETYGVVDSPGLNDSGFGGAQIGRYEVYFEYGGALKATSVLSWRAGAQPGPTRALKAYARIYTFMKEPSDRLMEELKRVAKEETVPLGGGALEYMKENKGLFLSRQYEAEAPKARFQEEIEDLLSASEVWTERALEDCIERSRA